MEKKEQKALNILNIIAIFMVYIFSSANGYTNAAIQKYIEAFPDVATATIRMTSTMPTLVSLVTMLILGNFVGKVIGYRPVAIAGTICILVGGVGPFFFNSSWTLILCFRFVVGIGMGCFGIRNALVMRSFPPEKRATYIGLGSLCINLMSFAISPIMGVLAELGWRYTFLVYGLSVISLIIITFFLKEPDVVEEEKPKVETEKKSFVKKLADINPRVFIFAVFQMVSACVCYPLFSGMATLIAARELGTAVVAGSMLSCYTAGGATGNFLLGGTHKLLKKNTIPVCIAGVALGMTLILFGPGIPFIAVGSFICGYTYMTAIATYGIYAGTVSSPESVSIATILILAFSQLGMFASSYFITAAHTVFNRGSDVESAFLGTIIVMVVLLVLSVIIKIAPDTPEKKVAK